MSKYIRELIYGYLLLLALLVTFLVSTRIAGIFTPVPTEYLIRFDQIAIVSFMIASGVITLLWFILFKGIKP